MKKILFCSPVIFILFFLSVNVQGALVFDQPTFTTAIGVVSSPYDPVFGMGPGTVYDDFTPATTSNITGITWWGFYAYKNPPVTLVTPGFTYAIYADSGGSPDTDNILAQGSATPTPVPYTIDGIVIDQYSIALDGSLVVTAATKYWLSIYDTASTEASQSTWGWQDANPQYHVINGLTIGSIQRAGDGDWNTSNVAFQLYGSVPQVPIPAAAWLLGSGLIAFVVIRRRMRTT